MRKVFIYLCLSAAVLLLGACGTPSESIETTYDKQLANREFWEKAILSSQEAFSEGKLDAMDEFYSPDVVFNNIAFPPFKGLNAFKQAALDTRDTFSDIWYENEEMIIDGDRMATRFTFHAKTTGPLHWLPVDDIPIGKEVYWKAAIFCHAKNGKIVEVIEVSNYLILIQQLAAFSSK